MLANGTVPGDVRPRSLLPSRLPARVMPRSHPAAGPCPHTGDSQGWLQRRAVFLLWCQAAISNVGSEKGSFAAWSLGLRCCWKREGNEVGWKVFLCGIGEGSVPGCPRPGPPQASLSHRASEAVLSSCFPAMHFGCICCSK